MSEHRPDCRWQRTTDAECEYRETHHYCPHAEHACTCPPEPVEPVIAPIGFYLWTDAGYAFRNKLHRTREAADAALQEVVWRNRHTFIVRAVYLDVTAPAAAPRTE